MNRIVSVKKILVCVLTVCVVFAVGCSKKQKLPAAPPSEPNLPAKKSTQKKSSHAKSAFEPNAAARKPADPNRLAKFRQVLSKELDRELRERKADANRTGEPCELTLTRYDSLADSNDKVDFILDFAAAHPESMFALVDKALDDNDVDVRSAAMEALIDNDVNKPEVLAIASKALKDKDEQIRQNAVEACGPVNDPAVGKILVQALNDESEDVRSASLQVAEQKEPAVRLEVLKTAIVSSYVDVKSTAVTSLTDMSSPAAVDVLMEGLKDTNPDIHEEVVTALNFLLSQEFETYDQWKSWWNANRNKFDDELSEKDE